MPGPVLPSAGLGLEWRPISLDDIDIWHELVHAIDAHDEPDQRPDRDDLIEELTNGSHKIPARDSLLGFDAEGVARAFGHVDLLPGTTLRRAFLWGGVHPAWRHRGIGREVLRWQTERAREAIAEREAAEGANAQELPWWIAVFHEEKLVDRNKLCAAAGFTAIRWFHNMVRPFRDPAPPIPEVALPDGFEMGLWTEDLDESVRLAHNEAFAKHWGTQPRTEEDWKIWTTGHRTFRRDWSRIVLDTTQHDADGRPPVAAYLSSHAFTQDWAAKGRKEGYVDLIGVRPAWRGRRLAPALLAEAMRAYEASGMDSAALSVDTGNATGALNLYLGVGFQVDHTTIDWALESPGAAGL
jgi:ribosomal protein S18 acetylase RimI-like enzyme